MFPAAAALHVDAAALDDVEFAVVDIETTGWSPSEAAITEVGAVAFRGGAVTGEFTTLVNPGRPVPAPIEALTGITTRMVAAAPPPAVVLPALLDFADGHVLAAHNAPFDCRFLVAACAQCGLRWPGFTVVDTVEVARNVLAAREVADHKLGTLAAYFGVACLPRHRALADARATAAVLHALLARLAAGGVHTVAGLGTAVTIT